MLEEIDNARAAFLSIRLSALDFDHYHYDYTPSLTVKTIDLKNVLGCVRSDDTCTLEILDVEIGLNLMFESQGESENAYMLILFNISLRLAGKI